VNFLDPTEYLIRWPARAGIVPGVIDLGFDVLESTLRDLVLSELLEVVTEVDACHVDLFS